MTGPPTAQEAAAELAALLVERFPDWAGPLQSPAQDSEPDEQLLSIPVPGRSRHSLELLVRPTEVKLSWNDRLPPGPAEALFVFTDEERADGHREIASFIADLIAGELLVVRRRVGFFRGLRRDCKSLASFARAGELGRIKPTKIAMIHSWDPPSTSISPLQLSYPALYLSPTLDVGVITNAGGLDRCAAALFARHRFYDDLRVIDAEARLYRIASAEITWPRSAWARTLLSFLDMQYRISARLHLVGPADLAEIRAAVQQAIADDPEFVDEMTGHDPHWWEATLAGAGSVAELIDGIVEGGMGD